MSGPRTVVVTLELEGGEQVRLAARDVQIQHEAAPEPRFLGRPLAQMPLDVEVTLRGVLPLPSTPVRALERLGAPGAAARTLLRRAADLLPEAFRRKRLLYALDECPACPGQRTEDGREEHAADCAGRQLVRDIQQHLREPT